MQLAHQRLSSVGLISASRVGRRCCIAPATSAGNAQQHLQHKHLHDHGHDHNHSHQQQQPQQQEQQQQQRFPQVPGLLELLSTHGARLTTAAQMVWAQVLQPGDTAVDATCGNGHDSLFMAQCIGPTGRLHGIDLQASAVAATQQLLESSLPPDSRPQLHLVEACHSQLQQLVGSNVASLVAFNLGYLPGGDKSVITQPGSTVAAVEAALEVLRPGGLVSIMAYIGHPGGLEEYEQVKELLAELPPTYWTSSELRLLNRPSAPVLLLLWRRPDARPSTEPTAAGK